MDDSNTDATHATVVQASAAATAFNVGNLDVVQCSVDKPNCIKAQWTVTSGLDNHEIWWTKWRSSTEIGRQTLDALEPARNGQTRTINLDQDDGISCGATYVVNVRSKGDGIEYPPTVSTSYTADNGAARDCPRR